MKKLLNCFILALFLFISPSVRAQLVQNGSFENPFNAPINQFFTPTANQMVPWTITGGTIQVHHRGHHGYGGHLRQHIDLNNNGVIQQNINGLTVGQDYSVSFIARIHFCVAHGDGATAASADVDIISNNITIEHLDVDLNNSALSRSWTRYTLNFKATSANCILRFSGTASNDTWGGVLIDDVILLPRCGSLVRIEEVDCDDYQISSFSMANYDAEVWYVNGIKTDLTNGPIHFEKGEYQICVSFFGQDTAQDTTSFCCNKVCETLIVEGIDTTINSDTLCSMNQSQYALDPCSNTNLPLYSVGSAILDQQGDILPCSTASTSLLLPGNYQINHYDQDSCLRWVELLTIVTEEPETTFCNTTITQCGEQIDPNQVLPSENECIDCYNSEFPDNYLIEEAIPISENLLTGAITYEKIIRNNVECKICVFTFEIIDSACNFTPEFDIITQTTDPYFYTFNQTAPFQNLCGDVTWTIIDEATGNVIYTQTDPAPGTGSINFNFPQNPGTYRITLNVCVCVCEQMCCRSRSFILTISPDPVQSIITDPINNNQFSPFTGSSSYQIKENNESSENTGQIEPLKANIQLIPNPSSSKFKIFIEGLDTETFDEVRIISSNGSLVKAYQSISINHLFTPEIASGKYFVKVLVGNTIYQTQLTIQD